ncbi:hypothetical protein [Nocardiopsis ansamitocini]|uniref:Transmembrane protein n=1 Tax=Nocardiopsis ansamitocini TaxID=1670832 RepID=A0A9W6P5R5_9ACTN|nr:hypothetical protein [Nocardiopsis ansamitocini]GLU47577.1 hypothetical protein Nans01_19280 [Nocardiopsis ansamitocini]
MQSHPTPEEAAKALNEVNERREQAAAPDAHPAWTLWALGAVAIGYGVVSDLRPDLSTPLLFVLVAAALALAALPRWKRSGSAMGYQRSPSSHPVGMSGRARMMRTGVMLVLMALAAAAGLIMRSFDVPYPTTIGITVVVLTIPLWRGLLNRAARDPKA